MADNIVPTLIASMPGIRRDGTRLSNRAHVDGQWVRFDPNTGRPRKILGHQSLTNRMNGVSRGLHGASLDGMLYLHSGYKNGVDLLRVGANGEVIEPAVRTPVGLTDSADNVWTFDAMQDVVDGNWKIIAHVAPNGLRLDSTVNGTVYLGDLASTAVLTAIDDGGVDFKVSGGIACLHPFMFAFGNDGDLIWSVSNKPSDVVSTSGTGTNIPAGQARPTGRKIVAGRATRGAVPTGLFWSLDRLVRASYVGGRATWDFDELAGIDIISARSIVEYNGVFFWIGAGRFVMFTGTVQDVPNDYNKDWFFKNITPGCEAKIYAFTVPSMGEVWWCAPMFGATECNHAVVMNLRGFWYDTPLPGEGRTAGISPLSTYPYPILAGLEADETLQKIWKHEIGYDDVDGSRINAIKSYYVTSDISFLLGDKPSSASAEVLAIEPDFVQEKALKVTVIGNANARALEEQSAAVTIPELPPGGAPPEAQIIELQGDRRQMRFKFESNTQGGYYEAGTTFAHIRPTESRETT